MYFAIFCLTAAVCLIFYKGARIVRPTQLGLVESFGRYKRIAKPGFHWVTPLIRRLYVVNVAEHVLDIGPQLVITGDNMNAITGAQVYIRVKPDEDSVKAALYNTDNYDAQILSLAASALKNIIATMPLRQLAGERERISAELRRLLETGTANWGVEILRAELGEIEFPRDVQDALNNVVKAELEKKAAADFAAAAEKAADGIKHADIKKAEGQKQAKILMAEGEAKAIRMICDAAPNSSRSIKALGELRASPNERERTGTK